MTIALYGRTVSDEHLQMVVSLFENLQSHNVKVMAFTPLFNYLKERVGVDLPCDYLFDTPLQVKKHANLMLSIGGDGTFLESVTYVGDANIPIAGVNLGRLGFLTHISSETISETTKQLALGDYTFEERTVLEINIKDNPFADTPFALNDFTIQKSSITMITIRAFIDGEFLSNYWSDGLIVSTPTGSTAYSLSVGGPIVSPRAKAFVISPIAPHNLTVRPLVIPDSSELLFEISAREDFILISADSRSFKIPKNLSIGIKKAPFSVRIVCLKDTNYYRTLRGKLMWGLDSRNDVP